MNLIVPLKQVPDLVEGLEVDASGKALNREWLKYKINEFDDHALEEALLLKEETGATVMAIALESEDVDKTLYTAAAKGADRLVKVTGSFGESLSTHAAARALADVIAPMSYDLILTGVQAADDRDGQLAGLLAAYLDLPQVSVVTGVRLENRMATVYKEYSGGVMAEFEVELPAVVGIQAARQSPRYAPVSRVRQMMRQANLEEIPAGELKDAAGIGLRRMFKPERAARAEIVAGSPVEVAEKILQILRQKGIGA
jgi:electron transfer flavoprotein beta subunit